MRRPLFFLFPCHSSWCAMSSGTREKEGRLSRPGIFRRNCLDFPSEGVPAMGRPMAWHPGHFAGSPVGGMQF